MSDPTTHHPTPPVYDVSTGVARFNAWFFDAFAGFIDLFIGGVKRPLLADLPPVVVELGAGAGANLKYMEAGTRLIAVEPNPYMHDRLRRRARRHGVEIEIVPSMGEAIALEDDTADLVLVSLVLCTVRQPDRVLDEVRRILRPGGRFLFVEHVAASKGTWRHRLQRAVRRPWRYVFEGCEPDRCTGRTIRSAGFESVDLTDHVMRSPFVPANTLVAGVAVEGG